MKMQCTSVITLFVSFISVAVSAGDYTTYQNHVDKLKNKSYCCGVPQPRVFELAELSKDNKAINHLLKKGLAESIAPQVTVLYRCESTGYCENNKHSRKRCVASAKEKTIVTFRYEEGPPGNSIMRYVEVEAEHHKKCICEEIEQWSDK